MAAGANGALKTGYLFKQGKFYTVSGFEFFRLNSAHHFPFDILYM